MLQGARLNILITGCAGFIGSHMSDLLVEKCHKVVGVDMMTYAADKNNMSTFIDKIDFFQADICNTHLISRLADKYKIDWIINFAAESHVDNSIKNSDPFIRSNIQGVVSLLNVCRDLDVGMLHISTDEVYGSTNDKPFKEDDKLDPRNPYSSSKAAAEHFITSYHNTYGVTYKMVRMSNNFGPRQHGEKLLPTVIRCIGSEKSIPVYGDGKNIRDWFYVKDCVKMIYDVLCKGSDNQTYNLTHENEMENLKLIETVCKAMNKDSTEVIKFVDDRPGHDFRYSMCNKKVKSIGISDPTGFNIALRETIDI